MIIRRGEIEKLSADIRKIIDGHAIDLRDNLEGQLSILKNDIHTLAGRLNEQAETLQKEKIALADSLANISHQLKTPLTAMSIMAELLETAPSEKHAEFVLNLKQGLTQTSWLVNALLKMAKLDSDSAMFSRTEISESELLELALRPLRVLLEIKNQRVKPAGEAIFRCDKNWTAEALTNILKNASEYSPEGSTIEVLAGKNPLCDFLAVTDAGAGIPAEKMRGLFRRYGNSQSGTGIGLPLALAIMQKQNGDIEVGNAEVRGEGAARGAVFTLKFYRV